MANVLEPAIVQKLARLARIEIRPEEMEKFCLELGLVLDYVAELQKIDVSGVEEISQVTGLTSVTRADEIMPQAAPEKILQTAPEIRDGFYKVKSIL